MIKIEDIQQTLITLKVDDNQVLFLLISNDELINRKGDGNLDCKDNDLFIGKYSDNLFGKIKPYFTEEMNEYIGQTFKNNEIKGRTCDLSILVKGDNFETGTQFIYGELSQGPPNPFRSLVIKAIELTEPWFQEQKRIIKDQNSRRQSDKPWWKFW